LNLLATGLVYTVVVPVFVNGSDCTVVAPVNNIFGLFWAICCSIVGCLLSYELSIKG